MLIKSFEGFSTTPYRDTNQLLTIGWGHLLTKDELSSGKLMRIEDGSVRWTKGISVPEAELLLAFDLRQAENAVNDFICVELNQNQFDALVSFAFNVGVGAFLNSTLRKKLNKGLYQEVPRELRRWTKDAQGHDVMGLVRRREQEALHFQR